MNTPFNTGGLIDTTEPKGVASISGRASLEVVTVEFEMVIGHGEAVTLAIPWCGVFAGGVAGDTLA